MRFYRLLLHLYPASFRNEYGREMSTIFAEHRRRVRGAWAVTSLWLEAFAEIAHDAARVHWDLLRQDTKYALRTFAQSPGFALTALLISALGIGATTAVFSLADHVLLRPLPYPEAHRLMQLYQQTPLYQMELSPPNFRDWKAMSKSFSAMGAYTSVSMNFTGDGDPERLEGVQVTADVLPLVGVEPMLGRFFLPEEDRAGASGTVILSYGFWQRRFGGSRNVLGKAIRLGDEPYVIIGVMPSGFNFPRRGREFWLPFRFGQDAFEDRGNNYLQGVARLGPGVSVEQARAEMEVVTAQLEKQYPAENENTRAAVFPVRDAVSREARLMLGALAGASVCLLLIACSNLANLLLARALARRKEFAVRAALGAGRERLVRQLLTESFLLAFCGGALGVLLAITALPMLTALVPNSLPIAQVPAMDWRMFLFAGAFTLLTGIGFGVVPALRRPSENTLTDLGEGGRGGIGGQKQRVRALLVAAEVMSSVLLLACSGLLLRALWNVQGVDPGFRSAGVVTARTWLSWPKYASTMRRNQFYDRVLGEVRALPGVRSAAYTSFLPMVMRGGIWPVSLDGKPVNRGGEDSASARFVTPDFFATMSIPMRAGRGFLESDTQKAPGVAVVSESFVKHFLPGRDPLGRHFKFANVERTIVGVVGDVRVRGLERESEPQVYMSSRQVDDGWYVFYAPKDLVFRVAGDTTGFASALREIVRRVDPEQPISDIRTLDQIVETETTPRRVQLSVLGAFAAMALILAVIGIYGLLSFAVSQRTQEIGVRVALGARPSDVLRLVLGNTAVLALAGTGLGMLLSWAAGRTLASILAGVPPYDPPVLLGAAALAMVMTLVGSMLPALRALRVDPAIALRSE